MYNQPDGLAARVLTYDDDEDSSSNTLSDAKNVKQGFKKRSGEGAANMTALNFSFEELEALIKSGHGSEMVVPANDSFVPWDDRGGMIANMAAMFGTEFRWDSERYDEDDEDLDDYQAEEIHHERIKKLASKRQLVYRSTSDPLITPLLKRASLEDIEQARGIVEDAISESSMLNEARLAKPVRNTYGLQAGTVVGTSSVPKENATTTPPPLLQITDEIADAAALVAEADAAETAGNVTRRVVAASGTYWMESLSRQGAVPWGDDTSYKVFRNVLDYGAVGDGVTVSWMKENLLNADGGWLTDAF